MQDHVGVRDDPWPLVRAAGLRCTRREPEVAIAEAEANRFANQINAFQSAPSVYKTRMKLETFMESTAGSRKYILSDPANRDVINLELQDKLRQDLLNVTVEQDN
mgnify:CR=1 FL=1